MQLTIQHLLLFIVAPVLRKLQDINLRYISRWIQTKKKQKKIIRNSPSGGVVEDAHHYHVRTIN